MRINYKNVLAAVSTAFMVTGAAQADGVAIDLSGDSARIQYNSTASMSAESEFEWDAGFLYAEGDNGDINLATVTARSVGDAGVANHQVKAAMGVRGSWLHGDGFDGQALGVGGEVSARFQGIDRLVFAGYAYYAPKILAFGDADDFLEWGVRAGYQVLRNGELYLGYRQVKLKVAGGPKVTPDTGLHLGMRFSF